MNPQIGIDLGGTKIELLVIDQDDQELYRKRVATPANQYESIVESITNMVLEAEAAIGSQGQVGVGIPGAISPTTGLVKNANTTCLIGRDFERDLSSSLARTIKIENDANCFTLSEAVDGNAQDGAMVFGAILGTGVGAGIVHNKSVHRGRNFIAGEWGHNPMPGIDENLGYACYCGRRGCIETYLAGPALSREYLAAGGGALSAQELGVAATRGDELAAASLERYFDRLARGLSAVVNVLDPDVIVLGGGLSQLPGLPGELRRRLPEHVFSDSVATAVVTAKHGPASGVRGAARLWNQGGGPVVRPRGR